MTCAVLLTDETRQQRPSLAEIMRAPGPTWMANSCPHDSTHQIFHVAAQYMGGVDGMVSAGAVHGGMASGEEVVQSMSPPAQVLIKSLREREELQFPMSM